MTRLPFETVRSAGLLAALALLAACGGDLTVPDDGGDGGGTAADAITVQNGDGQDGTVGEALETPLVVRVTAGGAPLAGQGVLFEPADGSGDVSPDTAVSDSDGRATARWTLGGNPGAQTVSARLIAGGQVVRFSADAAVGAPVALAMVSGDDQSGSAFSALPAPLVVAVADRFGNPVAGVTVRWTVASGRGELSDDEVPTGDDGRSSVVWTLGFALGDQRAVATVDGLDGSPVSFRASIF